MWARHVNVRIQCPPWRHQTSLEVVVSCLLWVLGAKLALGRSLLFTAELSPHLIDLTQFFSDYLCRGSIGGINTGFSMWELELCGLHYYNKLLHKHCLCWNSCQSTGFLSLKLSAVHHQDMTGLRAPIKTILSLVGKYFTAVRGTSMRLLLENLLKSLGFLHIWGHAGKSVTFQRIGCVRMWEVSPSSSLGPVGTCVETWSEGQWQEVLMSQWVTYFSHNESQLKTQKY